MKKTLQIAWLAALLITLASFVRAQTAPHPSSGTASAGSAGAAGPIPVVPAESASAAGSIPIMLDPFEVEATPDQSYGALNSNSLTAFKTALDKMPVSADVFDKALMDDTGLQTVEQMLQFFSAGSGSFSSQPDGSASNQQYLDRNANGSLSLRGLQAPSTMLNGFFPAGGNGLTGTGVTSNFNLEKVEVINGPQALLYGVSGAGGVVNETTKQARLGAPAFGSFQYQVDQYGHKMGLLDYGMGTDRFALRLALIDQTIGGRRVNIGGPMNGIYVQAAVRPVANTVVRVSVLDTAFDRLNANSGTMTFTALSAANDARNGQYLHYLLATNQLNAAANGGASGGGVIPGLNWNNIDSIGGIYSGEPRLSHLYTITADTTWTRWLTTQVSAGYLRITDAKIGNSGASYDAPNVAANPTGADAVVLGASQETELWEPARQKVARISALADNQLFGGRVHSQTILGADTSRSDNATISEYYVQADQNGNPVKGTSSYNGYTVLPNVYWGVPSGPVLQAYYNPQDSRITYNGVNYVRAITNATNPALISPSNQEGLVGGQTGDFRHATNIQSGYYLANYSDFFNGNLTTLVGARYGRAYYRSDNEASAPNPPSVLAEEGANFTDFNLGVNVRIAGRLRAYAEVSDSSNPPGNAGNDPYGNPQKVAHGLGEEVGLKESIPEWNLSGSLALYHANSRNEQLGFTTTIMADINPSGLNGPFRAGGVTVAVNRDTRGAQMAITAAPSARWRFRLSAAYVDSKINNGVSYPQLYNDQFHENSAGAVTYADGTVVYVSPTYNSKAVIAAPASSAPAGYVPLTVAMMNTSGGPYYANPLPVSSAITPSSNVASVLKSVDPVHGAILTGATGLPISSLQIAPNALSPPPGVIVVTNPGDAVTGFPRFSMNFAGMHTFPDGPLKGFRLGGTVTAAWKYSMYYYFVQGAGVPNSPRIMFYEPTQTLFTGILGYQFKFKRVTLLTQLNINNMFNHYHVLLLPSYVNGWTGPDNATFDQQPRYYVWSNTIKF